MTNVSTDKEKWNSAQWVDWLRGFFEVTYSRGSEDVKGMMLRLSRLATEPDGTEQDRKDRELAQAIIAGFGP